MRIMSAIGGNKSYRSFWGARTASYIGDFITLTALVLYLQDSGAGPGRLALALAARALPQVVGPLAGSVADLVDARKLMIACDLGRLLLIGFLAIALPPFPVLITVLAATSLLSTFFLPAGKSTIPKIVPSDQLGPANALLGMSHNVSLAVGPAVGALLFAHAGTQAALAVDTLTFAVSTLLLLRLPPLPGAATPTPAAASATSPHGRPTGTAFSSSRAGARRVIADMAEGLAYVARHRTARTLAVALFLGVSLAGLDNVALVFLLRDELGAGAEAVGLASSLYGAAMILAPLLLLRATGRAPLGGYFVAGLAAGGLGLLLTGVSPVAAAAVGCYAIAGVGNGLENVACDTLLGQTVPEQLLGRVFGAIYGPIFLAETLAAGLGSALLAVLSPRTVFVAAGCGLLALCVGVRIALSPGRPRQNRSAADGPAGLVLPDADGRPHEPAPGSGSG